MSEPEIRECLDVAEMVSCSKRAGDFTTEGHSNLIYGYGADGFSVNDPFRVGRSAKLWTYDSLEGQIKSA